jgi:hypothetical protein
VRATPPTQGRPKEGTAIFDSIIIQSGVNITLVLESIELIGNSTGGGVIDVRGTSALTLLIDRDTVYLPSTDTAANFLYSAILASVTGLDTARIIIDSNIASGSNAGKLTVAGQRRTTDAGIGGGYNRSGGYITIAGGTI